MIVNDPAQPVVSACRYGCPAVADGNREIERTAWGRSANPYTSMVADVKQSIQLFSSVTIGRTACNHLPVELRKV